MTWDGWRSEVLLGINAPVSIANQNFLDAWANAEGGSAAFNPMNTTEDGPGATSYNNAGVKEYPNYVIGLIATVKTLTNGLYDSILEGLRSGNPIQEQYRDGIGDALNEWGTGSKFYADLF